MPLTPVTRSNSQVEAHSRGQKRLPSSSSEPNLQSYSPTYATYGSYAGHDFESLPQTPPPSSPENASNTTSRGRSRRNDDIKHGAVVVVDTVKRTRSRSPVKRLLGIGKGTPTKGKPQPPEETKTPTKQAKHETSPSKTSTPASGKNRTGLKQWGDRLRHGFLSADQEEVQREAQIECYMEDTSPARVQDPSTFPVSLDPAYQARVIEDTELMLVITANRFLLREAKAGRLSAETIARTRKGWEQRNLPQVVEYQFDQATQRELVLANISTVQFCGNPSRDAILLNTALHAWGKMALEMRVRTYCSADSVFRKYLNDTRHILEMLGAPLITTVAYDDMSMKVLHYMNKRQHERLQRKKASTGTTSSHARSTSGASEPGAADFLPLRHPSDPTRTWYHQHQRNISDGSYGQAAEEAFNGDFKGMRISPRPSPSVTARAKNKKVMHLRQASDPRDFSSGGWSDGAFSHGAEDRIRTNMQRMQLQNGPARQVTDVGGSSGYAQAARDTHGGV